MADEDARRIQALTGATAEEVRAAGATMDAIEGRMLDRIPLHPDGSNHHPAPLTTSDGSPWPYRWPYPRPHYQCLLYPLVRLLARDGAGAGTAAARGAKIAVETGIESGVSDLFLCEALKVTGGALYNCDPVYADLAAMQATVHGMVGPLAVVPTFYGERSSAALVKIAAVTGPTWDLFLHDSDHDVRCTSSEYEFAWGFVRPGGIIASDDYTWGNPPHRAWDKFCARHGLTFVTLGGCAVARKPLDATVTDLPPAAWMVHCAILGDDAVRERGSEK